MIELTEEQVGRLLAGRTVTISVGEPWDFASPDGENILRGRIAGVSNEEADKSESGRVYVDVTPFEAEAGIKVSRLAATARHRDGRSLVELLAVGEEAAVNLSYADRVPDREDRKTSPFLIGGVRLSAE